MAKVKVTLDITGFYFHKEVEVADTATVKEVMSEVARATAKSSERFTFSSHTTSRGEFCRMIQVDFDDTPNSRQVSQDGRVFGPPTLNPGKYFYDDMSKENMLNNPQLAWQYYIVRESEGGTVASAVERVIVPFSTSNAGDGSVAKLKKGDRIIWRLVGICTENTSPKTESPGGRGSNGSRTMLVKYD